MTVVVNGRFLRDRPTGLHRTARALLAASRRQGLDAHVVAPRGTEDPLVDATLRAPPGRAGSHVWEQVLLPANARGRTILSLTNTAPLLASRSVVMVHDLAPLVGPQWFRRSMALYGRLVLAAARSADRVCTVSTTVADELADRGVDAERLHVVRPAVDPVFRPAPARDQAEIRDRLGLVGPFLLVVGWADPRKDLATAVAAHRRLRASVDHRLVLVGHTHPVFAPVTVPDDASIVAAGYVAERELVALYTAASALVYPSRYEGFGLPPLEAWACGTPAVVADVPVLRETTRGQATLVPPGDLGAWATALEAALRGELTAPTPASWTWDDAAQQLRDALAVAP